MLVLSRNASQDILIGNNIIVTLLSSVDGRAKIGISAPPEVLILRRELQARKESHESVASGRSGMGGASR